MTEEAHAPSTPRFGRSFSSSQYSDSYYLANLLAALETTRPMAHEVPRAWRETLRCLDVDQAIPSVHHVVTAATVRTAGAWLAAGVPPLVGKVRPSEPRVRVGGAVGELPVHLLLPGFPVASGGTQTRNSSVACGMFEVKAWPHGERGVACTAGGGRQPHSMGTCGEDRGEAEDWLARVCLRCASPRRCAPCARHTHTHTPRTPSTCPSSTRPSSSVTADPSGTRPCAVRPCAARRASGHSFLRWPWCTCTAPRPASISPQLPPPAPLPHRRARQARLRRHPRLPLVPCSPPRRHPPRPPPAPAPLRRQGWSTLPHPH